MKAKEYTKKILEQIDTINEIETIDDVNKLNEIAKNFLCDFMSDFKSIMNARSINEKSNPKALINLIKEFDVKWNKIAIDVNLQTEIKFNMGFLKYGAFENFLKSEINGMAELLSMYK